MFFLRYSRLPSLTNLTELIISRNKLGELPLSVCECVSLKTLNVASAGLSVLPSQ